MECTAVRCVRRIRQKWGADPLSKSAAAAAAAKPWFAKLPLDYMLHNTFPWKRCSRRSAIWQLFSLWRNLSTAACRPCDRSLILLTVLTSSFIYSFILRVPAKPSHVFSWRRVTIFMENKNVHYHSGQGRWTRMTIKSETCFLTKWKLLKMFGFCSLFNQS